MDKSQNILILGAGWVGRRLVQQLRTNHAGWNVFFTNRKRIEDDPHSFEFRIDSRETIEIDSKAIISSISEQLGCRGGDSSAPAIDSVLVTFPVPSTELAQSLYDHLLKHSRFHCLYGTTSAYDEPAHFERETTAACAAAAAAAAGDAGQSADPQTLTTLLRESSDAPARLPLLLFDEKSPLTVGNQRNVVDEFMRESFGTTLLVLSGLWGDERQPLNWLRGGRIPNPVSRVVNLVHVSDVMNCTEMVFRMHAAGQSSVLRGERIHLTSGRATSYASLIRHHNLDVSGIAWPTSIDQKWHRVMTNGKLRSLVLSNFDPDYRFRSGVDESATSDPNQLLE